MEEIIKAIADYGTTLGILIYLLSSLMPKINALQTQNEIHKLEIASLREKIQNLEREMEEKK